MEKLVLQIVTLGTSGTVVGNRLGKNLLVLRKLLKGNIGSGFNC